jgi:hypothetical protein
MFQSSSVAGGSLGLHSLEHYEPIIGATAVADHAEGRSRTHNACGARQFAFYGGGRQRNSPAIDTDDECNRY